MKHLSITLCLLCWGFLKKFEHLKMIYEARSCFRFLLSLFHAIEKHTHRHGSKRGFKCPNQSLLITTKEKKLLRNESFFFNFSAARNCLEIKLCVWNQKNLHFPPVLDRKIEVTAIKVFITFLFSQHSTSLSNVERFTTDLTGTPDCDTSWASEKIRFTFQSTCM